MICLEKAHSQSISPRMRNANSDIERVDIRCHIFKSSAPKSSSWLPKTCPTTSSRPGWTPGAKSSANGANASFSNACAGSKNFPARVGPGLFPPELVVQVKALACELPSQFGLPLSRWSLSELNEQVCQSGLVARISDSTLWRWLHEDAIRPWFHRCWIFPRDPQFALKAGRLLDLYQRVWEGQPLQDDEFVLSADEKTSIQARARIHPTQGPQPGQPMKVEHEYERRGALTYLAALDVHRAKLFGHCQPQSGIVAFDRLVDRVMSQPPYSQARRVFWIVDNGSSHRGTASIQRLRQRYPRLHLVHGPVHGSWLNQVEVYFSIIQRKVLTPNDFKSLDEVAHALWQFERHFETIGRPFEWKFTRDDLHDLLAKLATPRTADLAVAA